jgi:hypothetical protein
MTSASESEVAVRNYLLFLEDPSKLIDKPEVERLEEVARSTSDPLERLRTINRLQQIREGDGDSYRQAFCANAKAWADANDIRPASFVELGVDEGTLRAAGFSLRGAGTQGAAPRPRRGRGAVARQGQGQVRVEQVKEAARRQTGDFTLADLAAQSGASPMTIRKAVDEMIAAGEVERLGPTPNWAQPGRAPIQFRRATKRGRR